MGRTDTKVLIAEKFIPAVEQASLGKVRVADLISALGINRNTFYYHFANKYDVAMWILRHDLARELRNSLPERRLVCCPLGDEDDEDLPYFVHYEIGAHMLDGSLFFKSLARCVLSKPVFYRKLFNAYEVEFLKAVDRLWQPAFRTDIEFILGKRYIPEATKRFLTHSATQTMIAMTSYLLEHPADASVLLDNASNPFWNIVHETLHRAIQEHPINRASSQG